jgi:hypothetical protein
LPPPLLPPLLVLLLLLPPPSLLSLLLPCTPCTRSYSGGKGSSPARRGGTLVGKVVVVVSEDVLLPARPTRSLLVNPPLPPLPFARCPPPPPLCSLPLPRSSRW